MARRIIIVIVVIITLAIKISSMRDWRSTLCNWRFCQVQSHVTKKLGQISKIWTNQIQILCPSFKISGQLPAPIVNSRGDSILKIKEFLTFKGAWLLPWPWIGSYCIPSCITHQPLPICQISLKSKKLLVDWQIFFKNLSQQNNYSKKDCHKPTNNT